VFFRITGHSNDGEAIGAQGVPLTPGRSIAVDRLHDYGTPFFIEANLPIESAKHASAFQRLMIAQDTGSGRAPISTWVPAMTPATLPVAFAIQAGSSC
jgi:membrane-bound lytic murein transglycosylase A